MEATHHLRELFQLRNHLIKHKVVVSLGHGNPRGRNEGKEMNQKPHFDKMVYLTPR